MVLRSVTSSARPKEQGQTPICWKFMHHFPALSSLAILTKMDATNEIVPGAGSLASKALYITLGEIPPCHSMKSFDSEGLGGHFKGGCRLLPLIFSACNAADGLLNQERVQPEPCNDFLGAEILFDIGAQNLVEDFVRWQRILVCLVGSQFGGWRFLEACSGNRAVSRPLMVQISRQLVNHSFRYVRNHRESSRHVTVKRAIPYGQFGFV